MVAQSVEQQPFKLMVVGSIPTQPTRKCFFVVQSPTMAKRTDLQEVTEDGFLTRSLEDLQALFLDGGINLWGEIQGALFAAAMNGDKDFRLLDDGCGSGTGVEHILRLLLQRPGKMEGKISAVGIDKNPLPDLIPKAVLDIDPHYRGSVLSEPNFGSEPNPLADLRQGDVCNLDLPDNSVNIGYSVGTLIYVTDTLKALSEAYRVLKPGGKFFFEICEKDAAHFPQFSNILAATPGASKVLSYVPSGSDKNTGFVICVKRPDVEFKGFDYEVVKELSVQDAEVGSRRSYYRNAVYRAVRQPDPGVGKGKPNRRVDKAPELRFEQFLERVYADATAGRFPIGHRERDCERFNQFPMELNDRFETGNIDGVKDIINRIGIVLLSRE